MHFSPFGNNIFRFHLYIPVFFSKIDTEKYMLPLFGREETIMAKNTSILYRNQVMYSIYVRNYSEAGNFEAVRRDLGRIKNLGVDVIWLMPIHPCGVKNRKGFLGSPYAISDYRAVNPEFGTLEDLKALVQDIHDLGMKCIIDVVYNHTAPDSVLAQTHPEWFYHRADGSFGNRIGDWYDVIDLDYSNKALWDYQIETLKYWAQLVDGFRCDVAPLVPLEFWLRAREAVEEVRPGCLWLSESIEPGFITYTRSIGLGALSDGEVYQAFDLCYDYDIFHHFLNYLMGEIPLSRYAEAVNSQEFIYPENYVKLRYLENHDNNRAAQLIPNDKALRNHTALQYFQKGMMLLYAGQEVCATHTPGLFDKDTVNWNTGKDLTELLQKLYAVKKHPLMANGAYTLRAYAHDIALAYYEKDGRRLVGVFSLRGETGLLGVDLPDGRYENLLDGGIVEIRAGRLGCSGEPVIFEV